MLTASLDISQEEAQRALADEGILAPWYLRPSQLDIYDLLLRDRNPFIECSRRFGKTTSILIFVKEMLNANPGWICRWCLPWQKQARLIVRPIISKVQQNEPKAFRLKYQSTDTCYVHQNGSMIYLIGVNDDSGESARGPAANIIVADEYGSWKNAGYVITDILRPQLQSQEGQWLIRASTPPADLGHVFYQDKERAIRLNRYIKKTIFENEALSKEELSEIIEETGGVETATFRREYLCEEVSDPLSMVVPEFSDQNVVEDDYPRPDWPTYYVAGDAGFDDNTAILFFWYDFLRNEIVFDDEIVTAGQTTKHIIDQAKEREVSLWGKIRPHRRVYDTNKQSIVDIYVDHKYPVSVPEKNDRHAAIHEFRLECQAGRIKAKKRCRNLIRQLKVGMWKDERRTDFQRADGLGHLDAIAAAVYGLRVVDRKLNPVPLNLGLSIATHHIPPASPEGRPTEAALSKAFGVRR